MPLLRCRPSPVTSIAMLAVLAWQKPVSDRRREVIRQRPIGTRKKNKHPVASAHAPTNLRFFFLLYGRCQWSRPPAQASTSLTFFFLKKTTSNTLLTRKGTFTLVVLHNETLIPSFWHTTRHKKYVQGSNIQYTFLTCFYGEIYICIC